MTTIKKAAHLESNTAKSESMISNNYIDITDGHCPDKTVVSSLSDASSEDASGANEGLKSLDKGHQGVMLNRTVLTPVEQPHIRVLLAEQESVKRGCLTADTPRLKHLKTGIDQYTLTFNSMYYRSILDWLQTTLNGHWFETGPTGFYKGKHEHTESRTSICFGHNQNDSCKVEFHGQYLSTLSMETVIDYLDHMLNAGGTVTRIDLYLDQFGNDTRLVEDFISHAEIAGNTRLKTQVIESKKSGENLGKTLYLGSKNSARYWRMYDKGCEQGSQSNVWQRVELQCNRAGEYAHQVAQLIQKTGICQMAQLIQNIIFHDTAWVKEPVSWKELRNDTVDIRQKRTRPDLVTFIDFVGRQMLPTIRMLAQEAGITWQNAIERIENVTDDIVAQASRKTIMCEQFTNFVLDNDAPPVNIPVTESSPTLQVLAGKRNHEFRPDATTVRTRYGNRKNLSSLHSKIPFQLGHSSLGNGRNSGNDNTRLTREDPSTSPLLDASMGMVIKRGQS